MSNAPPPQESLWRGDFGDAYTDRNRANPDQIAARTALWASILRSTIGRPPASILEVGANLGQNLRALRNLTNADLHAVEPNAKAREALTATGVLPATNVLDGASTSLPVPDDHVDLVFTSGVLIHVAPDNLLRSCAEIVRAARAYIICIEYFADVPQAVPYRGQTAALFKRDFGAFYLDNFPHLRLLDYGFAWKRVTGLDNLTWWVFQKPEAEQE